jgi:4-alpha-glucanotransferase
MVSGFAGYWVKGPGMALFDAIKDKLGNIEVIAEDLGFMTPSVEKLVKKSGYPNMKVLQFGFDPDGDSPYLPHNYPENCVVYTGTHDNDTSVGAFAAMKRKEKAFAKEYLNIKSSKDVSWAFVRAALASRGNTVIIPVQDYLSLGSEARINTPSTLGLNWQWRLLPGQLDDELADKISRLCFVYAR